MDSASLHIILRTYSKPKYVHCTAINHENRNPTTENRSTLNVHFSSFCRISHLQIFILHTLIPLRRKFHISRLLLKFFPSAHYGDGVLIHIFLSFSGLEYCLNVENINLTAIRTIRVLRPLRAINRIPSKIILTFEYFRARVKLTKGFTVKRKFYDETLFQTFYTAQKPNAPTSKRRKDTLFKTSLSRKVAARVPYIPTSHEMAKILHSDERSLLNAFIIINCLLEFPLLQRKTFFCEIYTAYFFFHHSDISIWGANASQRVYHIRGLCKINSLTSIDVIYHGPRIHRNE